MITKIRGYCFKRRIIWFGWLIVESETRTTLYADNKPYMTIGPDLEVRYLVFGLTEKSVRKKLVKKAKKLRGAE